MGDIDGRVKKRKKKEVVFPLSTRFNIHCHQKQNIRHCLQTHQKRTQKIE
jgi:hypothetical protein